MTTTETPGQRAYETELQARPNYHDGTPRPQWCSLSEIARWSWERNPTPRWRAPLNFPLAHDAEHRAGFPSLQPGSKP